MLTMTGEFEIGTQLVVTFVQAHRCVTTEKRINGRSAFLSVDSIQARAGDKCRVTIVDQTPDQSMYFVRVDDFLIKGDRQTSLLEKTLCDVESGCRRGEQNFERKVIARLRARCTGKPQAPWDADMLEVLLGVLESYTFGIPGQRAELKYGHYCIVISRLVSRLHAKDEQARAAIYRLAAQYCSANEGGRQWAESFMLAANCRRGGAGDAANATA